MAVYLCPVCHGKGIVAQDFYNLNPAPTSAGSIPVTCRSCNGKGVVFDSDCLMNKSIPCKDNNASGTPNPSSTPTQTILDDGFLGKVGL